MHKKKWLSGHGQWNFANRWRTRLVPSRPTDSGLWPTTPDRKDGQGTNRLSGHGPL